MFNTQSVLNSWDVKKENQKAQFMEHLYFSYGRGFPTHPLYGLYTGLWEEFCIKEAGAYTRDYYFQVKEAIEEYEAHKRQAT